MQRYLAQSSISRYDSMRFWPWGVRSLHPGTGSMGVNSLMSMNGIICLSGTGAGIQEFLQVVSKPGLSSSDESIPANPVTARVPVPALKYGLVSAAVLLSVSSDLFKQRFCHYDPAIDFASAKVICNLRNVGYGECIHLKFVLQLCHRILSPGSAFHAIHGYHQSGNAYRCSSPEQWHCFADGCAGCGNVFNDQDLSAGWG